VKVALAGLGLVVVLVLPSAPVAASAPDVAAQATARGFVALIAEAYGIPAPVVRFKPQEDKGSASGATTYDRTLGGYVIKFDGGITGERESLALLAAHEMGHVLLAHPLEPHQTQTLARRHVMEAEADWKAYEILQTVLGYSGQEAWDILWSDYWAMVAWRRQHPDAPLAQGHDEPCAEVGHFFRQAKRAYPAWEVPEFPGCSRAAIGLVEVAPKPPLRWVPEESSRPATSTASSGAGAAPVGGIVVALVLVGRAIRFVGRLVKGEEAA
jgi:hypothetical protein